MTKEQTRIKLEIVASRIHTIDYRNSEEVTSLKNELHVLIENSELSYREAYKLIKDFTKSQEEFNIAMFKLRPSILKIGKV